MNFIKKISFLGPMLGLWFGGLRILQINWNGSFAMDDPGLINFLGSNKITLWTKIFDSTSANRWRPVTVMRTGFPGGSFDWFSQAALT
jgi:hypothetical protein